LSNYACTLRRREDYGAHKKAQETSVFGREDDLDIGERTIDDAPNAGDQQDLTQHRWCEPAQSCRRHFLPAGDPRIIATVEAISSELVSWGGVRRYQTGGESDGLAGGEGVFLPCCSFRLADNLVLMGRREQAERLFERHLAIRSPVGLLAEEYRTLLSAPCRELSAGVLAYRLDQHRLQSFLVARSVAATFAKLAIIRPRRTLLDCGRALAHSRDPATRRRQRVAVEQVLTATLLAAREHRVWRRSAMNSATVRFCLHRWWSTTRDQAVYQRDQE
jgi:hypothetical protein